MRLLTLVLMAGVLQQVAGAQAADPLEKALASLAADASDLQQKLPSFECKESFISQGIKGGKTKKRDTVEGTVRVVRGEDGKMVEHFSASVENGKAIKPEKLHVPYFLVDGFEDALAMFLPDLSRCSVFSLTGNRLEWKRRPDATDTVCKENPGFLTGFALLDNEGHAVHTEINGDNHDFEAVEFNGHNFWIAKHVTDKFKNEDWTNEWEANYSGCRLFSASVRLLPGDGAEGK
jgi:hypothetical protein